MKYFISACLMGKKCKYNGGDNYDADLASLVSNDHIVLICPEVDGGLPVPRNPVELNDHKALDKDGNDYTSFFIKGVESVVEKAEKEFEIYRAREMKALESDFDRAIKALEMKGQ